MEVELEEVPQVPLEHEPRQLPSDSEENPEIFFDTNETHFSVHPTFSTTYWKGKSCHRRTSCWRFNVL